MRYEVLSDLDVWVLATECYKAIVLNDVPLWLASN